MPRCLSNSPRAITNGVFPVPPTEILPMLITGRASLCVLKIPRSYNEFRTATPAPKRAETRFTGHHAFAWPAFVQPAADLELLACDVLLQRDAQIALLRERLTLLAWWAGSIMRGAES